MPGPNIKIESGLSLNQGSYGEHNIFDSINNGNSFLAMMHDDQEHDSISDEVELPDTRKTYTSLEPSSGIEVDYITSDSSASETDKYDLKSWTNTYPEEWNTDQVLDWLYFTAKEQGMDEIHGEAFNSMNGQHLCSLSLHSFKNLEPAFGERFYMTLQELISKADFHPPEACSPSLITAEARLGLDEQEFSEAAALLDFTTGSSSLMDLHATTRTPHPHVAPVGRHPYHHHHHQQQHQYHHQHSYSSSHSSDNNNMDFTPSSNPNDFLNYDYDFNDTFIDIRDTHDSSGYESDDSRSTTDSSRLSRRFSDQSGNTSPVSLIPMLTSMLPGHHNNNHHHNHHHQQHHYSMTMEKLPQPSSVNSRGRGRPKKKVVQFRDGNISHPNMNHRGRRHGQSKSSKGNHLWEFVRDLLKNDAFNPALIKWEDKNEGVFRFVQSEAVAHLWGQKKKNPEMTYEKLSRAMRFCRSAGYFATVPKTGKFPKKLCFKFGEKASDWS